jgi:hypothetical protein
MKIHGNGARETWSAERVKELTMNKIFQGVQPEYAYVSARRPRFAAIAVVAVLLLSSAVTLAATLPSVNRLLGFISPQIAMILQPIEKSCEKDGIKVEAVAAMNSERIAVFYFTVEDLESVRFDETLMLEDYTFSNAIMCGYEIIDFDPVGKMATIRMEAEALSDINNTRVKLIISSISGHTDTESMLEGPWEVEFYIQSAGRLKSAEQTVMLDGWKINEIVLSPIDLLLKSNDAITDHPEALQEQVVIRINMKDGSTRNFNAWPSMPTDVNKGMLEIYVSFSSEPLETEAIRSVTIDGIEIEI